MFVYKTGNLLNTNADALVNTVNCIGVMEKGLALMFKEQYPYNFLKYKEACSKQLVNIGKMFIVEENDIFNNKKLIINFPTKIHWKYPSEYTYIEKGLVALRQEIINRQIKSIAIPALGCSNGGLNYNLVKPMIETILKDLNCVIYVYECTYFIN